MALKQAVCLSVFNRGTQFASFFQNVNCCPVQLNYPKRPILSSANGVRIRPQLEPPPGHSLVPEAPFMKGK